MMKRLIYFLPIVIFTVFISCDVEPIDPGIVAQNNNNLNCQAAVQASVEASANFASATEENYEELCSALAAALQNQINICGDDDSGTLQAALDALDCTVSSELCPNATALAQAAQVAFENATDENFTQLCNAYAVALEAQINACGDPEGELQAIIDGLGDCGDDPNATLFLHQMTYTYANGDVEIETYSYDGDKLTSISYSDGDEYEYIYENNLLTRINYSFNGVLEDYVVTEYNSSNQLISYIVYFTDGSNEGIRFDLTYNTDGTITIQEYLGDHDSQSNLISESVITMGNNQIIDGTYGTEVDIDYTYDNNNGIFKNISNLNTLNLINIDFSGYIESGLNNILIISESSNGVVDYHEEWNYTYNSDDYPESATYYLDGELDSNIQYTYY